MIICYCVVLADLKNPHIITHHYILLHLPYSNRHSSQRSEQLVFKVLNFWLSAAHTVQCIHEHRSMSENPQRHTALWRRRQKKSIFHSNVNMTSLSCSCLVSGDNNFNKCGHMHQSLVMDSLLFESPYCLTHLNCIQSRSTSNIFLKVS